MKTVKLSRRYDIGSTSFDSVTFREPKLGDYRKVGAVFELQAGVLMRFPDAIWAYADRLLDTLSPGALSELDLVDALRIEGAILGFFTAAIELNSKLGNSSSGSDGAQPTSTG